MAKRRVFMSSFLTCRSITTRATRRARHRYTARTAAPGRTVGRARAPPAHRTQHDRGSDPILGCRRVRSFSEHEVAIRPVARPITIARRASAIRAMIRSDTIAHTHTAVRVRVPRAASTPRVARVRSVACNQCKVFTVKRLKRMCDTRTRSHGPRQRGTPTLGTRHWRNSQPNTLQRTE